VFTKSQATQKLESRLIAGFDHNLRTAAKRTSEKTSYDDLMRFYVHFSKHTTVKTEAAGENIELNPNSHPQP